MKHHHPSRTSLSALSVSVLLETIHSFAYLHQLTLPFWPQIDGFIWISAISTHISGLDQITAVLTDCLLPWPTFNGIDQKIFGYDRLYRVFSMNNHQLWPHITGFDCISLALTAHHWLWPHITSLDCISTALTNCPTTAFFCVTDQQLFWPNTSLYRWLMACSTDYRSFLLERQHFLLVRRFFFSLTHTFPARKNSIFAVSIVAYILLMGACTYRLVACPFWPCFLTLALSLIHTVASSTILYCCFICTVGSSTILHCSQTYHNDSALLPWHSC